MLRLDDGESGQLITPLTTQTLSYIGAANEAQNKPAYFADYGYTVHGYGKPGGAPADAIKDDDNLSAAVAKLAQGHTNRYGDTVSGPLVFAAGSGLTLQSGVTETLDSGSTLTCANGATVNFQNNIGTQPFVVTSTTKVNNLNADLLDGYNTYSGVAPAASGLLLVTQANGWLYTPNSAPTANYHVANRKFVLDNIPAVITDHGALTGLADNDHPQYGRLASYNTWTNTNSFTGGSLHVGWETYSGYNTHVQGSHVTAGRLVNTWGGWLDGGPVHDVIYGLQSITYSAAPFEIWDCNYTFSGPWTTHDIGIAGCVHDRGYGDDTDGGTFHWFSDSLSGYYVTIREEHGFAIDWGWACISMARQTGL